MPKLIGTAPNQVPVNGFLGNMAFQNKEGVVTDLLSTTALTVTGTASFAGSIAAGLGSAAAPSFTFTGDTNTGMFSPGADTIAFSEGGAEVMRIDSSGNLLVGATSNPYSTKALINGSLSVFGSQLNIQAGTSGVTPFEFVNRIGGGFDFYVNNASNRAVRIDSSGNLLVGTTSGGQRLVLKGGDTDTAMYLENGATSVGYFGTAKGFNAGFSGTDILVGGYTNNVIFANNSVERMRIANGGNVGIGTASPAGKLDVTGSSGSVVVNTAGDQIAYTFNGFNYLTASGAAATLQIQANGASGKLTFATNAAERMRIDSSGNVGIGTSAPTSKLNVSAGLASVGLTWGAASTSSGLLTVGTNGYLGSAWFNTPAGNSTYACGLGIDGSYSEPIATVNIKAFGPNAVGGYGSNLCLYTTNETSSLERMRIDRLGNVGISNTTPRALLHVGTSASLTDIPVPAGNFAIVRGGGYNGATAAGIQLSGGYGDAGRVAAWQIKSVGSGSGSNFVNDLLFTTQNGFSGSETERMRIASNGDVSIGTSSALGGKLNVFGGYVLVQNGAGTAQGVFGSTSNTVDIDAVGANAVRINTNATERMRIDASGNVGIGTAPSVRLDVNNGAASVEQWIRTGTGFSSTLFLKPNGSGGGLRFQAEAGETATIYNTLNSPLAFGTNNTERMRITNTGNVGIGTLLPGDYGKLAVVGTIAPVSPDLSLQGIFSAANDGQIRVGGYKSTGTPYLVFTTATDTERARIDTSGNLMVGTTSSSGSASNTARVIGGIFSTLRSSASVANNTATTIATLPSGEGNYMVSASLVSSGTPADYNEVAMVCVSLTTASITTLVNASQLSLSMSGLNLQVTHLQGLTQTIQYSVLRIL